MIGVGESDGRIRVDGGWLQVEQGGKQVWYSGFGRNGGLGGKLGLTGELTGFLLFGTVLKGGLWTGLERVGLGLVYGLGWFWVYIIKGPYVL